MDKVALLPHYPLVLRIRAEVYEQFLLSARHYTKSVATMADIPYVPTYAESIGPDDLPALPEGTQPGQLVTVGVPTEHMRFFLCEAELLAETVNARLGSAEAISPAERERLLYLLGDLREISTEAPQC